MPQSTTRKALESRRACRFRWPPAFASSRRSSRGHEKWGTPRRPIFHGLSALLLGLLTLFGDLGGCAGAFGLGLFLGGIALGICLVLLGLALAVEIIATGHGARDLLGLALNALDDALDGLFGTAVVVSHLRQFLLANRNRMRVIPDRAVR